MIKGIGIDAVELSRIAEIIETKPSFIPRVLSNQEYALFEKLSKHRKIEFLGGRYACKEAFSKAWGTGIGRVSFLDIEVLTNELGAPVVTKAPHPLEKTFVSITHTKAIAFAQIILED